MDFLGEIVSKKVRRKYIFMENVCFLKTMITGNVKSKHKQYDNWHSQDFFNRGPKRGREATERRKGPSLVWGRLSCGYRPINSLLPPSNVLLSDQRGNGGGGAWVLVPRSYASRVTVV